ncbi:MAG: ATP-grasp domain-containing protein [Saprospiraceae bacterium]|nr:ATP-grasp domain-containing protein [Saprospiraceae bacterium]
MKPPKDNTGFSPSGKAGSKTNFRFFSQWEYWSTPAIYLPLLPAYLWLAFRARSLFFFNAANPSFEFGGMAMDSKWKMYELVPEAYLPKMLLAERDVGAQALASRLRALGFRYPMVLKPEIGLKGLGVHFVENESRLAGAMEAYPGRIIVQEKIPHSEEAGIFYTRMPGAPKGQITGIVHKRYMSICGDGTQTLGALIMADPRLQRQEHALRSLFSIRWEEVLPAGKRETLLPIGSHTRGARFEDRSALKTLALEETFDRICQQIPGFYYGRLDVLYDNWGDLCRGDHFMIVEVNGAKSEPTHMYDPSHSLLFAWKEIVRHWKIMARISRKNKELGFRDPPFWSSLKALIDNYRLERGLRRVSGIK